MALCGNSLSRSLLGVKRTWQLHILKVRSEADFDAAFADIKRLQVGGLVIGPPHPVLWGVLAATLNFIPYLGAAIVIATLFVVGLIVFPTLGHAVIAPLAYLGITALEGAIDYADPHRSSANDQSIPRFPLHRSLDRDVGIGRRLPSRAHSLVRDGGGAPAVIARWRVFASAIS